MSAPETFEQYVDRWDSLRAKAAALTAQKAALTKDIDAELKTLAETEMAMRKAIAESVRTALGDSLKEGVNRFDMADGRRLKFTYAVTRAIDESQIAVAKDAYAKVNDAPVTFDQLLRVKYELEKKEWNKLGAGGKLAVSAMVTAKPAAPTLEIE